MASLGTRLLLTVLAAFLALTASGQRQLLHEGDLLFCSSDTANAITAVTSGVDGLPIDHVAVVHRIGGDQGPLFVIEAVKPCVRLTPINDFLEENALVIVGRVGVADLDVHLSVRHCLAMVGKPYDDLYLPGDSAVYCSELVQMNYVTTANKQIFSTIPMSFHDESGQITDYWTDFYARHGMAVPEGEPGTNPGELSRRPQVSILGTIDENKKLQSLTP